VKAKNKLLKKSLKYGSRKYEIKPGIIMHRIDRVRNPPIKISKTIFNVSANP